MLCYYHQLLLYEERKENFKIAQICLGKHSHYLRTIINSEYKCLDMRYIILYLWKK